MIKRDELGRFIKGNPAPETAFKKGCISPNKGRNYKCKQYRLTEAGRLQKIKNLGSGMYGKKHTLGWKQFMHDKLSQSYEEAKPKIGRGGYLVRYARGKAIMEHHYQWLNSNKNFGLHEIPKGFVIHHLDGNKSNNDINNLQLMNISSHTKIHNNKEIMLNSNRKFWGINKKGVD